MIPYAQAYEEGFEDMLRRVPDISKLSALTGLVPQFTLDHILKDVIFYTRGRLAAEGQVPVAAGRNTDLAGPQIAWQHSGAL